MKKIIAIILLLSFMCACGKKSDPIYKEGKIEKIESIELIRALENNINLGTFVVKNSCFAVDVNQDLMRAIDVMPNDKIRKLY